MKRFVKLVDRHGFESIMNVDSILYVKETHDHKVAIVMKDGINYIHNGDINEVHKLLEATDVRHS